MENRGGEVERREKHPGRRYGPAGTRPKVARPGRDEPAGTRQKMAKPSRDETEGGQARQSGSRRWPGPTGRRPTMVRTSREEAGGGQGPARTRRQRRAERCPLPGREDTEAGSCSQVLHGVTSP